MLSIILLFGQTMTQGIQDHQFLEIGLSYEGFISLSSSQYNLYNFTVPDIKNCSDFVVMVKSFNPLADPNIYISRKKKAPLSESDAEVLSCVAIGQDTCILTNDKVVVGEVLYLAVVSQYSCRYQLRINYDKELQLKENDFLTFQMNGTTQSKVINFNIRQLFGNESEIEILFIVTNLDQLEEPVLVYMNKEANGIPSNDKYDFVAKDLMDNKIIELNSVQFSSFQRYYILVLAQQGAIIQVYTQTNSKVKQLYLQEIQQQVVEKGSYDIFVTDIYNLAQDSNLYIQLTPFQGYASLFVNPNEQPPLLQNYLWTEKDQIGEMIEITTQELIDKNINLTKLYIGVYGEEFCTYEILVRNTHQYNPKEVEYLKRGTQNILTVEKLQLRKLQIMGNRENDFMFQITFKQIIGKANFILTNSSDWIITCPKLSCDLIENQKYYEELPNDVYIYSKTLEQDHFRLECQGNMLCKWSIILYLDKEEQQNGKLAICYHIEEDQLHLIENTSHKSYVDKQSSNYYKFIISEYDQIHQLQFLITSITGEVTIYVSMQQKYPNENNYDKKSTTNMINFGGGGFEESLIFGTYYIAILGNTASKYIITVWAVRNFLDFSQLGRFPWDYIQLFKGDPQSHQLQGDQVGLFRIDLIQYQNEMNIKNTVIVSLQVDYGSIEMFAFQKPETDIEKCEWKTTFQFTINRNDLKYHEVLYLRIQLNETYSSFASYRIVYQFEFDKIYLLLGNQYFSYLSENHSRVFAYQIEQNRNDSIIITKQAQTSDQNLLTMDIRKDKSMNIEFSKSKSSAKISIIDKNMYCALKKWNNQCIYSILITITAKTNLFYSVLVSEENGEIQLFDDQPLTKNIPRLSDQFYIYANKNEASIICSSKLVELTIIAKVVQGFEKPYPSLTSKDYDKLSKRHKQNYQSQIFFSGLDLQQFKCSKFCLIKLTVLVDDSHIDNGSDQQEYTIQYNSQAIKLKEGESLSGSIQNNVIKYYKANLANNKQNLMILATPTGYCDIDLYISKECYPTTIKYDWNSNEYLGDAMIIQAGNDKHPNMSGNYIIGVIGQNDCQFSIQYTVGNMQLYTIYSNSPQQLYISAEDTIYLKYQDIIEIPISIFLQSDSFQTVMFIEDIEILRQDFGYFTKDLRQFKYNNNGKGFVEITELLGGYSLLIALKSKVSELLTIQINSAKQFISLTQGILYTNHINYDQKLLFICLDQSEIIVQIKMKIGSINASYQLSDIYLDDSLNDKDYVQFPIFQEDYLNQQVIKPQSKKNMAYLKIIGTSDAIFSINFIESNNHVIQIKAIRPEYFVLRARDKRSFEYTSMLYRLSIGNLDLRSFSITIGLTALSNIEEKIKKELPDIQVYSIDNDYEIMNQYYTATDDTIYLEYFESNTQYKIIIHSNSQVDQLYFIQIGTSDLRPLNSKLKQIQSNSLQESTYWVTESGQQNILFYDFQFCGGLFQIYVGSDLDLLQKGQYDEQIMTDYNKKISGILENPKRGIDGEIYFKIQLYKIIDLTQDKASYTLRTYALNDQVVFPYNEIRPGDYGVIQYSIEQFSDYINLRVTFASLNYTFEDENYTVSKIEYYLLLQQGEELDESLINYCIKPYGERKVVVEEYNKSSEIIMRATLKDKKGQKQQNLVISVFAIGEHQINNLAHLTLANDEKITLEYNYESQRVRWNSSESQYNQFPILIAATLSVIMIFTTAIIVLQRYGKKRAIQKYEATYDRSSIELNYKGLVN